MSIPGKYVATLAGVSSIGVLTAIQPLLANIGEVLPFLSSTETISTVVYHHTTQAPIIRFEAKNLKAGTTEVFLRLMLAAANDPPPQNFQESIEPQKFSILNTKTVSPDRMNNAGIVGNDNYNYRTTIAQEPNIVPIPRGKAELVK